MTEHDPLINVPAEAIVLGGMMLDNRLIAEFSDRVRADDFAEPIHQRIYSAMMRFNAKGKLASAVSMRPVFAQDPDADGGEYLDALVDSPAAAVGVPSHVAQILDLSVRRKAREAMIDGVSKMENIDFAVGDVVGTVEEQIWAAQRDDELRQPLSPEDMVRRVQDRQDRISRGEQTFGVSNKLIKEMDATLGPLEQKIYILLAGRPGMGKTTLALSAAWGWAINGAPMLVLGTEMSEDAQSMRSVSDLSHAMGRGVPHAAIRHGKLETADLQWLDRVADRAAMIPLRYQFIGPCNWRHAYSAVAREKARLKALGKELWGVVIDYMGQLEADDANGKPIEDDRKKMNAVSRGMIRIRDELGVAVICLAQLSRTLESRSDKRPMNSDLKESGRLEEDADAIIFAYRDEYYLEQAEPKKGEKDNKGVDLHEEWEVAMNIARNKIDIIVGKNRNDQRRTRTAKFFGEYFAVRSGSYQDHFDTIEELNLW